MHIEVQVALNFVISYLYNKLPRRRVNVFGEELERALVDKFRGHWYPERPCRGSAYRCLKTGGHPVDGVLARAARDAGVPIADVLEHLPRDLAVWVDPGEVSYRIGEKGPVKVLFSEGNELEHGERGECDRAADREVTRAFNPDAQCFRPVETVTVPAPAVTCPAAPLVPPPFSPATLPSPPTAAFATQRTAQPLTFTTATFAQTKFGSTKLKTSSKRANRMSPTEFSNYIKQRAMQQQMSGRALSPATGGSSDPATYFFSSQQYRAFQPRGFETNGTFIAPDVYAQPSVTGSTADPPSPTDRKYPNFQDNQPQYWSGPPQTPTDAKLDSIGLNGSHYPHLLLAN